MRKFTFLQMIVLKKSTRTAAYGPENPYHCILADYNDRVATQKKFIEQVGIDA